MQAGRRCTFPRPSPPQPPATSGDDPAKKTRREPSSTVGSSRHPSLWQCGRRGAHSTQSSAPPRGFVTCVTIISCGVLFCFVVFFFFYNRYYTVVHRVFCSSDRLAFYYYRYRVGSALLAIIVYIIGFKCFAMTEDRLVLRALTSSHSRHRNKGVMVHRSEALALHLSQLS